MFEDFMIFTKGIMMSLMLLFIFTAKSNGTNMQINCNSRTLCKSFVGFVARAEEKGKIHIIMHMYIHV